MTVRYDVRLVLGSAVRRWLQRPAFHEPFLPPPCESALASDDALEEDVQAEVEFGIDITATGIAGGDDGDGADSSSMVWSPLLPLSSPFTPSVRGFPSSTSLGRTIWWYED
jgi:hypothetical protein